MNMWKIRAAETNDVSKIQSIEKAAAQLFSNKDVPESLKNSTLPRNCLCESIRADLAWVAIDTTGTPIGFSVAQAFGSTLHLLEVSVEPAHTRLGIGRSLVSTVIDKACAANFSIMTLTTFAHIPWNAPFYLSCGFRQISPTELSTRLVVVK